MLLRLAPPGTSLRQRHGASASTAAVQATWPEASSTDQVAHSTDQVAHRQGGRGVREASAPPHCGGTLRACLSQRSAPVMYCMASHLDIAAVPPPELCLCIGNGHSLDCSILYQIHVVLQLHSRQGHRSGGSRCWAWQRECCARCMASSAQLVCYLVASSAAVLAAEP